MRSKWHTLVVVGSLGLITPWNAAFADDSTSAGWSTPAPTNSTGVNSTAARSATANSNVGSVGVQRRVQELLRQAMVEMEANRFDSARRLARRAAAMGVTVPSAGVRPDQLLAEIDRREQAVSTARPVESVRNYKARAIELLDRGLLALDEKRFDDAEQCARQAERLNVTWDKYDYRPENLLNEIQRQQPSAAAETAAIPTEPARDGRAMNAAPNSEQIMQTAARAAEPSAPLAAETNAANDRQSLDSYKADEAFRHAVPQQPVAQQAAVPARPAIAASPAEMLLEQAKEDLRAGRDDLARRRIERALGIIPGSPQMAAAAGTNGYTAVSANRPIGLPTPSAATPAYSAAAAPQVYFPHRNDQIGTLSPAAMATDVALKPMHDPYLGDEATTTDKCSPGAQQMREGTPIPASVSPLYLSKRTAPTDDSPVLPAGYESTPATTVPRRVATNPEMQTINPQIGWLEKMSAPIPSGPGAPGAMPGMPPRGFNPAPIAPPMSPDNQWTAGRTPYPSTNDPAIANSPDQPKPGFFHKMWDALGGD